MRLELFILGRYSMGTLMGLRRSPACCLSLQLLLLRIVTFRVRVV